ncbi:MAG: hypothetical protein IJ065_00835 [Eubacterium sp.]|nr:hypothetical protein [Eubacterium sp.]
MRKGKRSAAVLLTMALLLSGCGAAGPVAEGEGKTEAVTESQVAEGDEKTEKETVNVTEGMIPQVIEKNVTYVMKGGNWEVKSSEITNWTRTEDFNIQDTVWIIDTDKASSIYSELDYSLRGKPATMYIHFGSDLGDENSSIGTSENGTQKMDISLNFSCDIIFECDGNKFYFEDVKVKGGECFMDGTSNIFVDAGDGIEGVISVPTDVRKGNLEDFNNALPTAEEAMAAESSTYIRSTIFEDIETFNSSSGNLTDGVWDVKITNTASGENLSPELNWDEVDGASEYVVIMIDGAWLHMDVFTTKTSLEEGEIERGDRGNQYVGPYPPSGTHTYSIFIFALKNEMGKVNLAFDAGGNSIDKIYSGLDIDKDGNSGNVIAYSRLDGNYTKEK